MNPSNFLIHFKVSCKHHFPKILQHAFHYLEFHFFYSFFFFRYAQWYMHIFGKDSLSFDTCAQLFNGDSNQNDITIIPKCLMPLLSQFALLPNRRDSKCSDFFHHGLVLPVLELHRVGSVPQCILHYARLLSNSACFRESPVVLLVWLVCSFSVVERHSIC